VFSEKLILCGSGTEQMADSNKLHYSVLIVDDFPHVD